MGRSFRLARLLRLRTQLRGMREAEVEQLAARVEALVDEVAAVAAERARQAAAERAATAAGRLTVDALQLGRTYDGALADRERQGLAAVAAARSVLTAKRDQLLHEYREEQKVRTLEEASRLRASEAEGRSSARSLDEMAVDRHERSRKRGGDGHG